MFGIFTDNKPSIIKAIVLAIAEAEENFEEVKKAVLKIIQDNKNAVCILAPTGSRMLVNSKAHELPKNLGVQVKGSSREMFQALNKISINANYDAKSDAASGDVENFKISMMRLSNPSRINVMVYIKNRDTILYQIIKDNGGKRY